MSIKKLMLVIIFTIFFASDIYAFDENLHKFK